MEPKWVHIFIHTLNRVPMNWYPETKLRHGTTEWAALKEILILTFNFESGFQGLDESLLAIQDVIFDMPKTPKE